MPIIFMLHSIQTVEMTVLDSELTDLIVSRDGFHRSNYCCYYCKAGGRSELGTCYLMYSPQSESTFQMFFLVVAAVGYQKHEAWQAQEESLSSIPLCPHPAFAGHVYKINTKQFP